MHERNGPSAANDRHCSSNCCEEPISGGNNAIGTSPSDDKSALPKKERVICVRVPPPVYNHAKAQAALSGLPFKHYMTRFLVEAFPFPDPNDSLKERE